MPLGTAAAAAAALDCGSSRSRLPGQHANSLCIGTSMKAVAAATALQKRASARLVSVVCFGRAERRAAALGSFGQEWIDHDRIA